MILQVPPPPNPLKNMSFKQSLCPSKIDMMGKWPGLVYLLSIRKILLNKKFPNIDTLQLHFNTTYSKIHVAQDISNISNINADLV